MNYAPEYIRIMSENPGVCKSYIVHHDGWIEWESHNGVVQTAKTPDELRRKLGL